jgi:DUF971 family protein
MDKDIWPTDIKLTDQGKLLKVTFDNGESFSLPAEFLRVVSPSAEVQGHGPDQKVTVPGKRYVNIMAVEPVGAYAVRLVFSDGHDTGLYTWEYLHEIGAGQDQLWADYLDAMKSRGLSR